MKCEWCGRDTGGMHYSIPINSGFFKIVTKYYGFFCSLACADAAKKYCKENGDPVNCCKNHFTEHDTP